MESQNLLRELDTCTIDESIPNERKRPYFLPFMLTFCILAAMWVVFSGKFDLFHLALGVISCALVAWSSSDMLFPPHTSLGSILPAWWRFIRYLPWLLKEILVANLHLLKLSFHPRMMDLIDPQVVKFDSKLKNRMALLTLANSITLTPGTITVSVSIGRQYTIHAIDGKSAKGLPGDMERRVAWILGEKNLGRGW